MTPDDERLLDEIFHGPTANYTLRPAIVARLDRLETLERDAAAALVALDAARIEIDSARARLSAGKETT